jgi:hypothetical protein
VANTVKLRALDLDLAEGAEVSSWANIGTAGGAWSQATSADRPRFRTSGISGRPAVEFGLSADADWLDNTANISNFISGAAFMYVVVLRVRALAATQVLVQETAAAVINLQLLTGPERVSFNGPVTQGIGINVPLVVSIYRSGGDNFIAVNGGSYASATVANPSPLTGDARIGANAAGAAFFEGLLSELWIWNTTDLAELEAVVAQMLALYGAGPAQNEPARDAGSRRLWFYRKPVPDFSIEVPVHEGLDVELLDRVRVTHFAGPEPLQQGWGSNLWQAPLMQVVGREEREESCTLHLHNLEDYLCLMQDRAWSAKTSEPFLADGVARFNPGVARTFNRASQAWHQDPGSGLYVEVQHNEERFSQGGELFEPFAQNILLHSAFAQGNITGWTKTGTGVNGSALANDTADTGPWDVNSTGILQSAKFTAGTTHTTDLYLSQTTPTFAANAKVWFTALHKTDSNEPLHYAIQRSTDSNWWRESDNTWQASLTWNSMGSASTPTRYRTGSGKVIDVGSGTPTLTVRIGLPSGGTSGRISHLYHAQLEEAIHPTSPIITFGAIVDREADLLALANESGARVLNIAQGALAFEFISNWNTADIGNNFPNFVGCIFDANNRLLVYYNGVTDDFRFAWEGGGSEVEAECDVTVVPGTVYRVAVRWTGAQLEHGLAQRTIDIWVNGVKGVSHVGSALTEAASADFEIGSTAAGGSAGGILRNGHSYQNCPADAVMARLPF